MDVRRPLGTMDRNQAARKEALMQLVAKKREQEARKARNSSEEEVVKVVSTPPRPQVNDSDDEASDNDEFYSPRAADAEAEDDASNHGSCESAADKVISRLGNLNINKDESRSSSNKSFQSAAHDVPRSVDLEDTSNDHEDEESPEIDSKAAKRESMEQDHPQDFVLGDGKFVIQRQYARGLYEHQLTGIEWLWGLHEQGTGGILGDDMGLGKTRQIATFLAALFKCGLSKRCLLVVPGTLIPQWRLEFSSVGLGRCHEFTSGISQTQRPIALHRYSQEGGVLLTTYEMMSNISVQYEWDYLILDEGHLAKNPGTKRFKGLKQLNYKHCIILSGTPIQNSLKELWALFDLACEGLLGDYKEYRKRYEKLILDGSSKDAAPSDKRRANHAAKALRVKIKPHFLRRMKREIFPSLLTADAPGGTRKGPNCPPRLPLKHDLIVWLQLALRQGALYKAFLTSDVVQSVLLEATEGKKNVLPALSMLKRICDHPGLLSENTMEELQDGLDGEMERNQVDPRLAKAVLSMASDDGFKSDPMTSCKLRFLRFFLPQLVQEGHRTLIFAQTKLLLNMVEQVVRKLKLQYLRMDGDTRPDARDRRVQEFQLGDIPLFLLTTKVGGLGLTLHAADRVIIMDPAWNPSVDNQSVDRAYRLGQHRDVMVYRLMTAGTVEEKIYRRQVFKDSLMHTATSDTFQGVQRYFNNRDLADLFEVPETFEHSNTAQQLEERHRDQIKLRSSTVKDVENLKQVKQVVDVSFHDVLFSTEDPSLLDGPDDVEDHHQQQQPLAGATGPVQCQPAILAPKDPRWKGDRGATAAGSGAVSGGVLAAATAVLAASAAMPAAPAASAAPKLAPLPADPTYDMNRWRQQLRSVKNQCAMLQEQIERAKKMAASQNPEKAHQAKQRLGELQGELKRAEANRAKTEAGCEEFVARVTAAGMKVEEEGGGEGEGEGTVKAEEDGQVDKLAAAASLVRLDGAEEDEEAGDEEEED